MGEYDDLTPFDFIHIAPDGRITLIINKSEMGQGVYTSLAMLIAEELECDWEEVEVQPASVKLVYNNPLLGMQMTGGSLSVRTEWERLRRVGAMAREMLIRAAANEWKIDASRCRAQSGHVISDDERSMSYGVLAEKAIALPLPGDVRLKPPLEFKLIGKPVPLIDIPPKIYGTALFGIDVRVPGMLTGLVARPPVFGGKVKSFDAQKARQIPGVRDIFTVKTGVAVVADTFWQAKRARDALTVIWDEGPHASLSTEGMREEYTRLAGIKGAIAREDGDPDGAYFSAATKISASYEVPYLAHACMEPLNCTVDPDSGKCSIWVGTQGQTLHRNDASLVLGVEPDKMAFHTTFLGGGFGRRGNPHSDFVVMAAEVARTMKKPVKVVWTREDDMRGGYYRPFWHSAFSAGIDETGNLVAWHHRIVGQSIIAGTSYENKRIQGGIDSTSVEGAANMPYEIPNILVDLHSPKVNVPVQWWRSVGHSHTGFVVESFIDEVAHAAHKDPYEFRRNLLKEHPRHLGVIDLAAQKAGWGGKLDPGHALGIAMMESYGSFVSEVAEVSVSPEGKIAVHKVVCAIDCGRIVNPSTIEAQMEGGIVYGLSAALYGAITLENGRVRENNFNDYPVLRIDEMPVVEVYIVPSAEAPGGVGEPGVPPIAAAVTNAIFAATGKRVRKLPILGLEKSLTGQ
ncbi:MAG: xanthine dehydrogenase family protein molybdopterin-binding subunit [Syntrophorhabdaceae bacterium]